MKLHLAVLMFSVFLLSGCSGCSKSGRMGKNAFKRNTTQAVIENPIPEAPFKAVEKEIKAEKTVVKMEKENGVYKIPVTVNGTNMSFIFDTGAGMISISNVEASYLYKQGKLTKDDVVGREQFVDANGSISVGTVIKLKEITIGNKTIYNINASVVNNSIAPLLFGQSALEQFGTISIDYKNGTITFE